MTATTRIRTGVVVAGLVLAGCTARQTPEPPPASSGSTAPAILQQVVAKTVEAGTSRFTSTVRYDDAGTGRSTPR